MNNQTDLEWMVRERLQEIKSVPPRQPQVAARARAHFLSQAVSASEFQRHKGWKSIFRKEQFAMNIFLSILVIAGLLFGGGATVNAAQNDLPDEPLYAIKTLSEDLSLQFQNSPQEKADRLMELAQIRLEEMQRLVEEGQALPDQVRLRLEDHINQILQLCSQMDDSTLGQTLLQLRDRLQQQDRDIQKLQIHATQNEEPILLQTRTMLQQRLQLVEDGLLDHSMFRNAVRTGFRYGQTQTPPPVLTSTAVTPYGQQNGQSTPPVGPTIGSGLGPNTDPGGPNPQATPMPKYEGTGSNGNHSGGDDSGGNRPGGRDSGGNSPGGDDTGGNGPGGNRP